MPRVHYAAREIVCKIVYYGPARSGKTTNLQWLHRAMPEDRRSEMVSLATENDRTLFFDYLPLDLGEISGFRTRFQLYTVPGQVYYNATRKLVLRIFIKNNFTVSPQILIVIREFSSDRPSLKHIINSKSVIYKATGAYGIYLTNIRFDDLAMLLDESIKDKNN
ncbi:MAG TPA: hypothetical protein VK966_05565 [Longimicrobiales bacterium]|nr:hypothetical protein [Longimicrobiales bacterium]